MFTNCSSSECFDGFDACGAPGWVEAGDEACDASERGGEEWECRVEDGGPFFGRGDCCDDDDPDARSEHSAGRSDRDGFGEEMCGDMTWPCAESTAESYFGDAFEHADECDVRDACRADEQ